MTKLRIYIVENDLQYGQFLRLHLSQNAEFEIELFNKTEDCLEAVHNNPDLVCVDYALLDVGNDLLLNIVTCNKNQSVVVFSGQNDSNFVVKLLKLGETDRILKNNHEPESLMTSLTSIRENEYLKSEVKTIREQLGIDFKLENFTLCESDSIQIKEFEPFAKFACLLGNESEINTKDLNCLHQVSDNLFILREKTLREYTIDIIVYYLKKYNQNVVKVAEKLDIGKSTIYNMIKSGEITLNK